MKFVLMYWVNIYITDTKIYSIDIYSKHIYMYIHMLHKDLVVDRMLKWAKQIS